MGDLHRSIVLLFSGVSANADPHCHKLRTRVAHIWGDRKGQPNRSAMVRPHSGGTAYLITVAPVPGKYAPNSGVLIITGRTIFRR